jgi:hypothetical protein
MNNHPKNALVVLIELRRHLEKMVSTRTTCNSMRRSWENRPLLHFDVWGSNNDLPQNTEVIGKSLHGLLFTEPKCFDENCQTCSSRRNSEPSFVQTGTQTQNETNFPG